MSIRFALMTLVLLLAVPAVNGADVVITDPPPPPAPAPGYFTGNGMSVTDTIYTPVPSAIRVKIVDATTPSMIYYSYTKPYGGNPFSHNFTVPNTNAGSGATDCSLIVEKLDFYGNLMGTASSMPIQVRD